MSPRPWNGSVVPNGGYLYLQVKADGRWVQRATGLPDTPENRIDAERKLAEVRAKLLALEDASQGERGPLTLERWGRRWLKDRARGQDDSERILRLHVFPAIGHMLLLEVRPRHLIEMVKRAQAAGKAPRTVRNIYSEVQAMFRDAVIADLMRKEQDPCDRTLDWRHLGRPRDKRTGWRATAVFTREELVQLISDSRIPEDRRVQYAVLGLAMVRLGEMAGLRFEKLQHAEPLGRMVVDVTYEDGTLKTADSGAPERLMPVHPTLAGILAEWRLSGWARMFGRAPLPGDLVLPVAPEAARKGRKRPVGLFRDRHYVWKRAQKDLVALSLRRRRVQDLRRTGISIAQDDGADGRIIRWGTHAAPREVFDNYTTLQWATLCREVAKIKIARPVDMRGRPPPVLIQAGDDDT